MFASWNTRKDLLSLNKMLVSMSLMIIVKQGIRLWLTALSLLAHDLDIAKKHPHIPELNVLVVGMPNVGKSTLLNSLRNVGIKGRKSFHYLCQHF